jgi:GT2 family glycosyltransferase
MRKDDYIKLGGFDENFFLYNEDSDLSWRSHLSGFRILFVPTSVIMHDYRLRVLPEKLYHLEKGRYLILRKYLSTNDLLFLLPSLIVAELLILGYCAKLGPSGIRSKFNALKDGLSLAVEKESGNKIELRSSLCATIPENQLTSNIIDRLAGLAANKIFYWNYRVFK